MKIARFLAGIALVMCAVAAGAAGFFATGTGADCMEPTTTAGKACRADPDYLPDCTVTVKFPRGRPELATPAIASAACAADADVALSTATTQLIRLRLYLRSPS